MTTDFDSPGAISYRCCIITESLSPTIFEIMGFFSYLGHDLDLSGSRDVIGHSDLQHPHAQMSKITNDGLIRSGTAHDAL